MSEEKKGGKFFNGLLWGAAIGGGVTYLLSTKRGRDLLKELASDGIDLLEEKTGEQAKKVKEMINPIMEDIVEGEEPVVPQEEKAEIEKKRFFKKAAKK